MTCACLKLTVNGELLISYQGNEVSSINSDFPNEQRIPVPQKESGKFSSMQFFSTFQKKTAEQCQ